MSSVTWKEIALAAVAGVAAPEVAFSQAQTVRGQMAVFSDAELTAYANARAEIEPIQLAELNATSAEQRARCEAQINAVLARNGLTREDYDSIATVAMADPSLSARIAQLADANDTPQRA